jgi:histidinol-phosphate aminotransferase
MSQFWSPIVHSLTPYVPGEQPRINNLVKLNTNENPYGPSETVLAAIREAANDTLRLYPDPHASDLKEAIAHHHGVDAASVFVGNGSDEVLAHVFVALLKQDRPLLFPDVTYSFYPTYCKLFGIQYRTVPVNERFEVRLEDYTEAGGAFIFPNPNAPTGHLTSLDAIQAQLARHPDRLLVVDEAYIDFGGESAAPLTRDHANLLVVQTMSKSRSLAGLRVGHAIGHPDLIDALERVKNSFNSYPLDRIALVAAVASFKDDAWFRTTCERVIRSRERVSAALRQRGFTVLPSHANFVFVTHPKHDAGELALALRERAVLVRHFRQPRIEQFLRISIGTDTECDRLLGALDEILGA